MTRPNFPKRVLITAGMPYGSKELHFGHVGGVFVHADAFARFMKDRIGKDNVIFVSGTDCYGSPIVEKHRSLVEEQKFSGSIIDFVQQNHDLQKETLKKYFIEPSFFGASALGLSGETHSAFSKEIFNKLYASGSLVKMSTKQFFDDETQTFLNGRQVIGQCPIQGCKSEQAYADECSLGHQYFPEELINPISVLSGKKPSLIDVQNWYLDVQSYSPFLKELVGSWENDPQVRKIVTQVCSESLKDPILYTKFENADVIKTLLEKEQIDFDCETDEQKNQCRFIFKKLTDREKACVVLAKAEIRFRTGKTLVPFRISGNIEWGVPIPDKDGLNNLTFWVWPESLWAPISFTKTYLKNINAPVDEWKNWWCSDDAQVIQFIGEDNIYFYTLAEMSLFKAVNFDKDWNIKMPTIVANKHILFFNSKASSSGKIKPPMANELLNYYSPEQLRAHFFGMGLNNASVPFQPKPFNPNPTNQGDPVYKEWSMFTNFLNRAVRTVFYTFQKYNNGNQTLPNVAVSADIMQKCEEIIIEFENDMFKFEFANVMILLENFFKYINKTVSDKMNAVGKEFSEESFNQAVIDSIQLIKTATTLSHAIAPVSTEKVREYLDIDYDKFYSWDYIFKPVADLVEKNHSIKFLEPRIDFFSRPEWQY